MVIFHSYVSLPEGSCHILAGILHFWRGELVSTISGATKKHGGSLELLKTGWWLIYNSGYNTNKSGRVLGKLYG